MNSINSHIKLSLFSVTLLLSAALMFGLQPMVGKMLLPMVGGTPSSWIVAMAFFQVMLLAGYFLAHALAKFTPVKHGILYLVSLGIGCFFLPIVLSKYEGVISTTPLAFDIFILLTIAVAVPFIAISATASTLQRLFTVAGHKSSEDPYFLYAASNIGSFAGLLLYPFYIEQKLSLSVQSNIWFAGYIILMALTIACIFASKDKKDKSTETKKSKRTCPTQKQRLQWIVLSMLPSALLLAVTTHITTDIFSAPLLWVIPLSVYLLTFIIAFSKKTIISEYALQSLQPILVAVILITIFLLPKDFALSWYALLLHLITFGIIALMCHMALAKRRPLENHDHLTDFYLMISIGGAIGGIFSAFIAPAIFNSLAEYPLLLIVSIALNEKIKSRIPRSYLLYFSLPALLLILLLCLLTSLELASSSIMNNLIITITILLAVHPRSSFITCLVIFLGVSAFLYTQNPILTQRNFYGVIKVYDKPFAAENGEVINTRYMKHGTTLHGKQSLDPKYEMLPTMYYSKGGPLEDIINFTKPKTVAIVGLGTGAINCYAKRYSDFTFFEIDPDVAAMAKEHFTFLSKCGHHMPNIIIGDARLEMQKIDGKKFDLIILDAFSSDTIPTHLLTKEAINLYKKLLKPNGSISFHISNRYFSLDPAIAKTAASLNMKSLSLQREVITQVYKSRSRWMVITNQKTDISPLYDAGWKAILPPEKQKVWTDDYTNLLSTLKVKKML